MRADNTSHLLAAAQRRSQAARHRAVAALRRLDAAGQPISFDTLAAEARVSRSWLYTQPDLRTEIERLRDEHRPATLPRVPDRQRATDASLRHRLELANQRIRELEADNQRLRQALAESLGDRRRDTPKTQISTGHRTLLNAPVSDTVHDT